MLKRTSSKKIDEAVAKSVNFEVTVADLAKRSERRAWWVAGSSVVMSLILAGGYFYMLPLKEKIPYMVMADAYTGTATVARLTEDFTNRQISTSEAINRSNVAHFVLARESFDVATMTLRDWGTVLVMSAPDVADAFRVLHAANNPTSPYKLYGRERAIRVKILSIVLIGGGQGQTPKGATVRFQRSIYNKQSGTLQPLDSKIATIEFAYKANLKMDDQYRIENPLGFQVTSYRVDNDYATAPPEEVPVPAAAPDPNADQAAAAPAGAAPAEGTMTVQPGAAPDDGLRTAPVPQSPIPEREAPRTTAPAPAAPAPRNTANGVGRR
ncbi:type IV secretion system protein VirB8 [Dyella sp. SG562]|uniref:virB8 family protein n=1 Tax=unclassified Dyella TaxID=2634549 RepID=UPI00142120BD|nr:type IV secretion system protein [Dyella sp. SG562]NII71897.1 type IV secretion system protein VirB8 [Dyella sp. SG562]